MIRIKSRNIHRIHAYGHECKRFVGQAVENYGSLGYLLSCFVKVTKILYHHDWEIILAEAFHTLVQLGSTVNDFSISTSPPILCYANIDYSSLAKLMNCSRFFFFSHEQQQSSNKCNTREFLLLTDL